MLISIMIEYRGGIYRHWAIQVNGRVVGNGARSFKQVNVVQQLLRTADREYGNNNNTFSINGLIDNFG